MNSKTRIALFGAACIIGCALASAASPSASTENSPAATDSTVAGQPPSQAFVWMTGHWNSDGGQWKWVAAHWELPPSRDSVWVAGHWVPQGGAWVWANGAWNVGDGAQAQAGPPQPPGQGVPTPSTPAPTMNGAYAPGGVVRAIDQPPVTTDYGPVDYGTAEYGAVYPDYYYWPGAAWYWGAFPGAFIDWGGGFYGWGGYGHWAHGGYYGRGNGGYYGRGGGGYGGRGVSGHGGGGRGR